MYEPVNSCISSALPTALARDSSVQHTGGVPAARTFMLIHRCRQNLLRPWIEASGSTP